MLPVSRRPTLQAALKPHVLLLPPVPSFRSRQPCCRTQLALNRQVYVHTVPSRQSSIAAAGSHGDNSNSSHGKSTGTHWTPGSMGAPSFVGPGLQQPEWPTPHPTATASPTLDQTVRPTNSISGGASNGAASSNAPVPTQGGGASVPIQGGAAQGSLQEQVQALHSIVASQQAVLQQQAAALQQQAAALQQLQQRVQIDFTSSLDDATAPSQATAQPQNQPPSSAESSSIQSNSAQELNPFAAQAQAYSPSKARSWTAGFATTRTLDAAAERSGEASTSAASSNGTGIDERASSAPSPLLMSVSPFEAQRVAIGDRRFLGLYDARFHSTSLGATPKDYRVLPSRIILVRHAESEGNVDNAAYTTIPDPQVPLTERGHAQAKAAGKKIKELMDAGGSDYKMFFYTSPYKRSLQTYEGISSNFPADCIRGVQEEVQLREQDFGNFQDLKGKAQEKEDRQRFGRFFYRFPNGESGADVYDRLTLFEDHMVRDINAGRFASNTGLVLITHGLALRVFLMRWFHWSVDDFLCVFNPPNAEPLVMERVVPKGTALNENNVWMHTKALYKLTPTSMEALRGCTKEMCTSGVQARLIRRISHPGSAVASHEDDVSGSNNRVKANVQAETARPVVGHKDDLMGTRVDAKTSLEAAG